MRSPLACHVVLIAALPACLAAAPETPRTVPVPGEITIAEADRDAAAAGAGFVWLRAYVKVPDRWTAFTPGQKNLWAESVTFRFDRLPGAHEVFVNGKLVGAGGSMPPAFEPAPDRRVRYKVPGGLMKKGLYNVVAIRLHNGGEAVGFQGDPPILGGYYDEFVMRGPWEMLRGDDAAWAIDATATPVPGAVFDRAVESSSPLLPPTETYTGPRLSPEQALAKLRPAGDLRVDQVLTEPLIAQPVHLSFDARGRLWVVQFRQYPYPAGVTMVSRDKYYRAVYDRVPPAPPDHARGADRITLHEDTDGDGVYDSHKSFLDGLNMCNSIAFGRGGVWVLNPPYLLFYPDRDHDDVPDGDPVVHLEGFGLEDAHSMVNGLRWGPNGWLYFAQGSTVASRVRRPGDPTPPVYVESTCIWRYHPETRRVEAFAIGGTNQLGIEFDTAGRLHTGTNNGGTRGHHYVQGGYYKKGAIHKFGPIPNPFAFGELPLMQHENRSPRFTHCVVRYESDALPARYHDRMLAIDPLQRQVLLAEMRPHGSTVQTRDLGTVLETQDPAFRPVDMKVGPDGHVYIADFYEYYIAHGQHYQGQIDPTTGRIYRLRGRDSGFTSPGNLTKLSTDQLIDRLNHPRKWVRQTALRLLGDRKDPSAIPRLRRMLAEHDDDRALGALWALNLTMGLSDSDARDMLDHSNPDVRRWAVRLSGDDGRVSDALAGDMASLAATETDAGVRCQLAATARRLAAPQTVGIVQAALSHGEDVDDPFIPLMIWWALEAKCDEEADQVLGLFDDAAVWDAPLALQHLLERVMRRFAAAGTQHDLRRCARLLEQAPRPGHRARLLAGFEQAFQNRPMDALPRSLALALVEAGQGSLELRVRLREPDAIDEALKVLGDRTADAKLAHALMQRLAEIKEPRALDGLLAAVSTPSDPATMKTGIAALHSYADPRIAKAVIPKLSHTDAGVRAAAAALLLARPAWARAMLHAVERELVDRAGLSPQTVEALRRHADAEVRHLATELFPGAEESSRAQYARELARVTRVLEAGHGNPYKGIEIFTARCAACHTLHGKGGRIGPDLTTYQRDDLPTLVTSVVNPSAEIREGFENVVVTTTDGRAYNGFVADRDDHVLLLRGLDGSNIALERESIESLRPLPRSLMPDNLLTGLSDAAVRDLVAYLRTAQPISR